MVKKIISEISRLSETIDMLTKDGLEAYNEKLPGGGEEFRALLSRAAPLIVRRTILIKQKERIDNNMPATSTKTGGME
jgi:hypothetical protein